MRVTGLFVYPLKSAGGIAVASAELDAFGIRHDRRWMVQSRDGHFLTQRDLPRLALIRTSIRDRTLQLDAPGMEPLHLPLDQETGARLRVRIWADVTQGVDAGADASRWISQAVGEDARIVRMPDDAFRPVHPDFDIGAARVSFADGFPLLLVSQASLDGLNARLELPLPMNRFRPNLVVDGTLPHAEDGWRRIAVGSVPLAVVKPCARCVTTTVDQDTGETAQEPLRTLATYRRHGNGVLFGQNAIHLEPGVLRVGDAVTVVEHAHAVDLSPT